MNRMAKIANARERFDREQRRIAKLQKKLARRQAKRLAKKEASEWLT